MKIIITFAFALSMTLSAVPMASPASAEVAPSPEYSVKAAFIYNFGKFVEWPLEWQESRTDSFRVAVVGSNPFGNAIHSLSGKSIGGRYVSVSEVDIDDDLSGFDVAFVGITDKSALRSVIARCGETSTLTVGEGDGFIEAGGMIRFFISEDSRVRFDVNLRAVENAGLSISSRLLRVARIVDE